MLLPEIDAPAAFVTLPPATRATPSYLPPAMLPLLLTMPAAPVTKTPNVPEIDAALGEAL